MFVVFDLDGTLADDSVREEYLKKDPPEWDTYFGACIGDQPIWSVIYVLNALAKSRDNQVEIWTGRPEWTRDMTEHWLRNYGVRYDKLRMRPDNDHRSSAKIKAEWITESHDLPDLMFDDRAKDVAVYRGYGILALDVQGHTF